MCQTAAHKKPMASSSKSKSFFTAEEIHSKRLRSEELLPGLSYDLLPALHNRFTDKSLSRTCQQCNKPNTNNRVYCYFCLVPVTEEAAQCLPPKLSLPLKLDVVRHPKELKTKSTALHAQVLCGSDQVRTQELPQAMDLLAKEIDPKKTLLLFPSKDAKELHEIDNLQQYERVVVIDSTWSQANVMLKSEFISGVCAECPRVKLGANHETSFWRHQNKGDDHLATIEAIYFFFKEYQEAVEGKKDVEGKYDNLLFIFTGLLRLIENSKQELDAK